MTSKDKLTGSELEDIAKRQMKIETDKGIYKIVSVPQEEWGGQLVNSDQFRSYLVEVRKAEAETPKYKPAIGARTDGDILPSPTLEDNN